MFATPPLPAVYHHLGLLLWCISQRSSSWYTAIMQHDTFSCSAPRTTSIRSAVTPRTSASTVNTPASRARTTIRRLWQLVQLRA